MPITAVRAFVAVAGPRGGVEPARTPPIDVASDQAGVPSRWQTWRGEGLTAWFIARDAGPSPPSAEGGEAVTLVLGDSAEWNPAQPDRNLVSGVPIRLHPATGLELHTSIVALPPVFMYRDRHDAVVLASDLSLMRGLVPLALDPTAVIELGWIGHPVDHRTLFAGTTLVPGGVRLRVGGREPVRIAESWAMPPETPLSWEPFIESQVGAFTAAMGRLDLSRSFLSLTAGLDTRTIFSALAARDRLVPAVTMTGPRRSLDARTAASLCRHYGVRHELVALDDRFTSALPDLVREASVRSGGAQSFDQAPEVFLYRQLGGEFDARLSGNLGNQVGRGGTEGVGLRRADLAIVSPDLRREAKADLTNHWLLADLRTAGALRVILQREIPFSSVANFSVGQRYAVQQTPYADRALLETLASKPARGHSVPSASVIQMRLRDMKHRFLGEPAATSFQRTFIARAGGFAAEHPINLGWRARGGVSPVGLGWGGATLVGMVAQKTKVDRGMLGALIERTGLASLHNFRRSSSWLRDHLRTFTMDVLAGTGGGASVLFDRAVLGRALDEHFSGRVNHHNTVVFALDLALAHETFCGAAARAAGPTPGG